MGEIQFKRNTKLFHLQQVIGCYDDLSIVNKYSLHI